MGSAMSVALPPPTHAVFAYSPPSKLRSRIKSVRCATTLPQVTAIRNKIIVVFFFIGVLLVDVIGNGSAHLNALTPAAESEVEDLDKGAAFDCSAALRHGKALDCLLRG